MSIALDDITLRAVRTDEREALLALYIHLHPTDAPLPDATHVETVWQAILQNPMVTCFVAEYQGQLIASCTLIVVPNLTRGARPYALIETVVTHGDYRQQGIGGLIMRHALSQAWAQNCYKVMLFTGRKDEAVFRFYEGVGLKRGIKTAFYAAHPDDAK